jgi:endonuclease/exonuclease/phosphatase family metal-dependent hydrolase
MGMLYSVNIRLHPYTHYKLPSGKEPRGLLKAEVKVGNKTISIYTTHLGLNRTERIQQFAAIETILQHDTAPGIVLGDFNTRPLDESYRAFSAHFANAEDVVNHATITLTTEHTQIDYVLHTKEFKTLKVQAGHSLVSDHNPLLYTLSLAN